MAEKSSRRFYIADLVAAVLFCGAFAALLASGRGSGQSEHYLFLMALVFIGWVVLRTVRGFRTCDECGRRFAPPKPIRAVMDCPHCGGRQITLARMLKQRSIAFFALAPLFVLFGIVALALFLDTLRSSSPFAVARLAVLLVPLGGGLLTLVAMIWLAVSRSRLARPRERNCETCGGVIPAEPSDASICPNCRNKKLGHDQIQKAYAKGIRTLIVTLAILAIVGVFSLVIFARSMFTSGDWTALPLFLPLAAVCIFFGWKMTAFLIGSAKTRALLSEEGALARARECAGEEGTIVRSGPTTVWYSGTDDPVPMLLEENSAAHWRFKTLLGETDIAVVPLRILCFHDRNALTKLYKASFPNLDLAAHLGIYFQRPMGILALCTGEVAGRLDDPRSLAGSLYDLVLLEQIYGTLPSPWVQCGVANRSRVENPVNSSG